MVFDHAISSRSLSGATSRGQTMAPEGQEPSQWLCLTKLPREMYSQPIVHKALSWGAIRKSACILAEITIRKVSTLPSRCSLCYDAGVGNLKRRTGWQKREGDNDEGKDHYQSRHHSETIRNLTGPRRHRSIKINSFRPCHPLLPSLVEPRTRAHTLGAGVQAPSQ